MIRDMKMSAVHKENNAQRVHETIHPISTMNDLRNLSDKKKSKNENESTRSRKNKASRLMSAIEADNTTSDDNTPFLSTAVYSDDEVDPEKDEEAKILNQKNEQDAKDAEDAGTVVVIPTPQKVKPKKNIGEGHRTKKGAIFTTLVFLDTVGGKVEIDLNSRPATYSELQREIARLRPQSDLFLVIQNDRGEKVFPENYIPSSKLIVRELYVAREMPKFLLKHLGTRWESTDYHDAMHKAALSRVEDV
jgi:hypothetical protein